MTHLAIRADGNAEIGYGHLVRTGVLAEKFLANGHQVTYLTQTVSTVSETCPDGVQTYRLDDPERDDVLGWIGQSAPDMVLTDSYGVDTDYMRALSDNVSTLVTITDDDRFTLCCDVNINGNVHAPNIEYEWADSKPMMLHGTEYLLMRAEFQRLATKEPPCRDPPERALVTFGGSDMNNATPAAVRAFDRFDLTVDVIIGPGFRNESEIERVAGRTDVDCNLLRDPEDLPQRMFEADLAVSAAGSTVYELLLTGTPVVAVPQTANQVPITDGLRSQDAVLAVDLTDRSVFKDGLSASGDPQLLEINPAEMTERISESLARLLDESGFRRQLRERGMSLVDGDGATRIYNDLRRL